jgi:hypothetical protein
VSPHARVAPAEAVEAVAAGASGGASGGASEPAGLYPLRSAMAAASELRRLILAMTLQVGVLVTLPGGLTATLIAAPLGHSIARAHWRQHR